MLYREGEERLVNADQTTHCFRHKSRLHNADVPKKSGTRETVTVPFTSYRPNRNVPRSHAPPGARALQGQ